MKTTDKTGSRGFAGKMFLGGVLIYLLAVLPFLIRYKGLFFYYGDYNVQQVPFLIFAHRAVRRGRFFWNPLVDLGGNMAGTFAFYLWGSPFFWLTIPFPEAWLPYMMPGLMALKYGTAAATAGSWIRTQTRSDRAAALGGLLYAFCGFQACNIVFQHFHDATAFFPLYLLAFDRFIEAGKTGDLPPVALAGSGPAAMAGVTSAAVSGRGDPAEADVRVKNLVDTRFFTPVPVPRAQAPVIASEKPVPGFLLALPLFRAACSERVEKRKKESRRSLFDRYGFVLMTAWMSVINYYFFFGQVIFFVLYYFVRRGVRLARAEGIRALAAELARILAGGLTGLLLAAFFLVQSAGGILGNTRVGEVLSGYDLIAYQDSTTPLAILKTFFMVPDLVARGTLFTSDNIRNGSLGFYLPCFAMAGVFAFWILRRRSWKKILLAVLAVMAFVPVLNASFSAFNSNFYVRWFYMPVLLCACMTAEALEEEESAAFTRGAVLSLACTALFILFCFLPVQEDGKWSLTAICENRKLLTTEIEATLLGAASLAAVVFLKRRRPDMSACVFAENPAGPGSGPDREEAEAGIEETAGEEAGAEAATIEKAEKKEPAGAEAGGQEAAGKGSYAGPPARPGLPRLLFSAGTLCLLLTVVCCISSTQAVLHNGTSLISYSGYEKWKKQMLGPGPLAGLDGDPAAGAEGEGTFCRVETDSTSTNYEMVWGYPTMHCFESTVHPSIFRWYRGIGMIRTVESTLPEERIGARAVMSVRYDLKNTLVKKSDADGEGEHLQGYSLISDDAGYDVYETENFIPMGFSFDRYMTEENYDRLENGPVSDRVLVRDIVLSEEMADKYGDLLEEDTDTVPGEMPYWEFAQNCRERAASACTDFAFDSRGFSATAQMERANLLLFSIPYDKGFSATIDDRPAEVERADFGLTAIFVPEGAHEIRVTYLPAGFVPCCAVSALTALALAAHALYTTRRGR